MNSGRDKSRHGRSSTPVARGEIDKAIAEYERLIGFDPKREERRLIHPKCHYRLARLYERKGLNEKAAAEFRKSPAIWKNADAGLPERVDAKKSLATFS